VRADLSHTPPVPARLVEASELERHRLALRGSGQVLYDWTLADDRVTWGDGYGDVLGLGADQVPATGTAFAKHQRAEGRILRASVLQAKRGRDDIHLEYEFHAGPGRWIWVEERGTILRDSSGTPQRVVGTLRRCCERKLWEARLDYLSAYDEATGHLNRVRLREALDRVLMNARHTRKPGAFLSTRIDDLAVVNETYGYDVADEVIVAVGRALAAECIDGDVIGRLAGNKFGIILTDCPEDRLNERAQAFIRAVRDHMIETVSGRLRATVTIGCVPLPGAARTSRDAMARAEEALERAKRRGRNAVFFYEPSAERESERKRVVSVADQIVHAISDHRIKLAYQPIVRACDREVELWECLVRMENAEGALMNAGEFIPVAEQLGLIRLIDQRVLELAVASLESRGDLRLALNVSAFTATDPASREAFLGYLNDHKAVAPRLTVEITETLAIEDIEKSDTFIEGVRAAGAHTAIDDFGAGYTSFRNLRRLDLDMVKIDGAFIKGLEEEPENQIFVRMLIDLAKTLGLRTVAEWVSSESEIKLLQEYGVDLLQGFHLGAPETGTPWAKTPGSAD